MYKKLFVSVWILSSFLTPSYAAEESAVNPIVAGEYVKVQNELSASMVHARKKLLDLSNDKKRAIFDSQTEAKLDRQGIEAFKKYDLLLTVRYADEKGLYQPAVEVSVKDVENLNKLFDTYLHTTPMNGRSSVGHARKMIDWGMKRLEELVKVHAEPTETNNPDLEIIAQQTKDADQRVKTVTELAVRLGVKLNETVAVADTTPASNESGNTATAPTTKKRRPASTPAN